MMRRVTVHKALIHLQNGDVKSELFLKAAGTDDMVFDVMVCRKVNELYPDCFYHETQEIAGYEVCR